MATSDDESSNSNPEYIKYADSLIENENEELVLESKYSGTEVEEIEDGDSDVINI
jgi:hypothetical protein